MSKSANRNIRKSRKPILDTAANTQANAANARANTQAQEEYQSQNAPAGAAVSRMEAANENQRLFISYLREGRKVVIAQGSAGTGKSFVAAWYASMMLKSKKADAIILVRANVAVGKSLGMLPGTLREKLEPHFAQTLAHLASFMGNGALKYNMDKDLIQLQSIEHMRGLSIENAIVIIEEAQNLTADELEMILSRLGDNTQMIFTGDQRQNDLKGASGLGEVISLINRTLQEEPAYLNDEDLDNLEHNVGVVTFTPEDVVRSGLCRAFVKMYYFQK